MYREMLRAKLTYPVVTQTELEYEGSITIDCSIMKVLDLRENEKVDVLNLNNGERFQTYVIPGPAESGIICLNGPAARKAVVGDRIVVLSYSFCPETELETHETIYVKVDERNRIKNTIIRQPGACQKV